MRSIKNTVVLPVLSILLPLKLHACPLIGGLVDYNCDQVHKMVFTGDSIVAGVGDTPKNRGGYPTRIAVKHPLSQVVNLGYPGINTVSFYRKLEKNFRRGSTNAIVKKFANSDLVVIDIGRNDYWDGDPPAETVRNIKRTVSLIRQHLGKKYWGAPPVAVSNLIFTSRTFQRFFIRSVMDLMIASNSSQLPVLLRPDLLGTSILGWDGIHPSKAGYDKIANRVVNKYITGKAQQNSLSNRADTDGDGIYNLFETEKYLTLPSDPDTDDDTFSDGDEIFVHGTDPLDAASVPVG